MFQHIMSRIVPTLRSSLLPLVVAAWACGCSKSSTSPPVTELQTNSENIAPAAERIVQNIPKTHVGTWECRQIRWTNGGTVDVKEPHHLILTSDGRMITVVEGKATESPDRFRFGTGSVLFVTYSNRADLPWIKAPIEDDRLILTSVELPGPSRIYARISSSTDPKEIQK